MNHDVSAQENLPLSPPPRDSGATDVENYQFEPIKGYPMLNWRGKRPFTSTHFYPAQLKESYGEATDGWRNRIYWGDNLQVMSHLLREFRGQVDLIYIDPPFDSKADYKKKIKYKGQETENGRTAFEEKQYSDIWTNDEYLQFMYERLVLIRELLSETGSFYLHVDQNKCHLLRCICDEVFGPSAFQREIIWRIGWISGYKSAAKNWIRNHDTVLFYTKSKTFSFNKEYIPYPDGYTRRDGSKPTGEGYPIEDTWNCSDLDRLDSIQIMSFSGEKVGYPTQKNENLIARIVRASSKPGDIVFDCFMGSGTTQAVAMKLGRRFIGADINLGAIQTTTKRLTQAAKELLQRLPDAETPLYTGFEVYNVNHYDIFRNPIQAKELLLEALEVQKLEFSTVFDGEKDGRMVKIMPVNRIATRADLNELITGFDYKAWERRQNEAPRHPVEKITLVCMGHEPDLGAQLKLEVQPFEIDVKVLDILRDKSHLEFRREAEAEIVIEDGKLHIRRFYPMNLLQKLSLQKEAVDDWRQLTESVLIDWNYDGAVLQPAVTDIPGKNEMVKGAYKVPDDAGTIRVKITDLLSESWEGELHNGN